MITTRASVIELNSQRSKHVVRNISGLPEAFAVTVLPRAAWIGVMGIHLFVLQRFLHCRRNHFGSGVATQARWATISRKRCSRKRCSRKRFSRTSIDVTSGQTSANRYLKALAGKLANDRRTLQLSSILGTVKDNILTPYGFGNCPRFTLCFVVPRSLSLRCFRTT